MKITNIFICILYLSNLQLVKSSDAPERKAVLVEDKQCIIHGGCNFNCEHHCPRSSSMFAVDGKANNTDVRALTRFHYNLYGTDHRMHIQKTSGAWLVSVLRLFMRR